MTKIVLAYDRSTFNSDDRKLLLRLLPHIGMVKVGLETMTAFDQDGGTVAIAIQRFLSAANAKILWDIKLYDIPNTMARTVANLAPKVQGITLHASAGPDGLRESVIAAHKAVEGSGKNPPILFGVTVLTSMNEKDCDHVYHAEPEQKVIEFGQDLLDAGCDGIVCSGKELSLLNQTSHCKSLFKLVPGIRPAGSDLGDQKRPMTPGEAAKLGADFEVIGRPIMEAADPVDAARRINEEIQEAILK